MNDEQHDTEQEESAENVGSAGNLDPDPAQQNQQPVTDADLHDPNKVGPASAPPAGPQSLDPATQKALAGERVPASGGSEPPNPD